MRLFVCAAALALAAACGDNDVPVPAPPAWPEVALVPATAGSDVDVLFVVDDTTGGVARSTAPPPGTMTSLRCAP